MLVELSIVAGDNAGAFLAAMLEGVEPVVGQFSGVLMTVNAEHTAVMFWIVLMHVHECRATRKRNARR